MSAKALRRTALTAGALAGVTAGLLAAPAAHATPSPDVSVNWDIVQDWGSGYQVEVSLTNNTNTPIDPWRVHFQYDPKVTSLWDGRSTATEDGFEVTAPSWKSTLAPGDSASFGLIGSALAGEGKTPATCDVDGLTCRVNNGAISDAATPPAAAPESTGPTSQPDDSLSTGGGANTDSDAVISVAIAAASDWGSGRTMDLRVTNESAATLNDWSVRMAWAGSVSSMWNAVGGVTTGELSAANQSWNGTLNPGATVSVGFGDSGELVIPTTCSATVAGEEVPCEVSNNATDAQPDQQETTNPGDGNSPEVTPEPDPTVSPAPEPTPTPADPTAVPSGPMSVGERKVIGYYPAWGTYARNYQVADIPGEKISHINYAFANISGGKCVLGDSYADIDKAFAGDTWDTGVLRGNFNQLIKLREQYPHLQTIISLGGWTWSSNFSEVAATEQSRKAFVDSCVDFMERYQFDGIDVDWEYPVSGGMTPGKPEDKANYTLLMQEFREALDVEEAQDGRDYWLSIAAPAGPTTLTNLELADLAATMDWMNLMSYDFHGGWDTVTGHNAPMVRSDGDFSPAGVSVTESVDTYLASGVPPAKLVLGVPFYGRGWNTDGTAAAGLFQSGKGTSLGTWEAASFDYTDLVNNYVPTMDRYWDAQAQVPYLFDPQRKLFISYDDPQSIAIKADYINSLGLGGAMFWELSGDRDEELLDALNATLD